ncbi:MAG TPA: lytic transglycosylase domain-containing protein [Blastocatellia bacterium]|nr:lytic transglycosylase domain-containing protein [Blastocatellia bacterium]
MLSRLATLLILLAVPASALAQQQPMSPPKRPSVPLTAADQERAMAEQAAKQKRAQDAAAPQTPQIKVPVAAPGRRISSGNPTIDAYVYEAAATFGLDPNLILSVMRAESGFNRMAVSVKGASGLMQLMPATAARFGVKNIFDPRENIMGGSRYLRWLLNRFNGDVRLALAGYNAGEGAVEFYGLRIPPFQETQNYVRTIYARYSALYSGATPAVATASVPAQEAVTAATAPPATGKNPTYNQIIRFTSANGVSASEK